MIDLKDYREQPDEGLFEKIQRRLKIRRALRIGGTTLTGVAIVAVAAIVLKPAAKTDVPMQQPTMDEQVAMVNETDETKKVESSEFGVRSSELILPHQECSEIRTRSSELMLSQSESSDFGVRTSEVMPPQLESSDFGVRTSEVMPPHPENSELGTRSSELMEPHPDNSEFRTQNSELPTQSPKANQQTLVEDTLLWAPNIILPNDDREENRVFFVKVFDAVTDFHLQIFNRRGMKVYSTEDVSFSWTADHAPQGGYVWIATFRGSDGRPHRENGTVVVVR